MKYPLSKSEREHGKMVKGMFSEIASRYDFMNHLLSLFFDVHWRRSSLKAMDLKGEDSFLDLACGTGDLGICALRIYPNLQVLGVDFNLDMLDIAKRKVEKRKLSERIRFLSGDLLCLPIRDNSFGAVGIAFGIRNIKNRQRAFSEIKRVTKKGGKVMVLEMGLMGRRDGKILGIYMKYALPFLAKIFSKDHMAYIYLKETISSFPTPNLLSEEMEGVGLKVLDFRTFWPGLTHMILAAKE